MNISQKEIVATIIMKIIDYIYWSVNNRLNVLKN